MLQRPGQDQERPMEGEEVQGLDNPGLQQRSSQSLAGVQTGLPIAGQAGKEVGLGANRMKLKQKIEYAFFKLWKPKKFYNTAQEVEQARFLIKCAVIVTIFNIILFILRFVLCR